MQYHVSAYLHYTCASREARESGSTTKEMRFREKRGKRREGGWAVVKLRATQPLPSSRDTISLGGRHSDTKN